MIANPMTARETFDAFYARKLDALKIELKAVIMGDIPYTVSATYACTSCQCRIFLHTFEGHILCMRCIMPASLMPSSWPDKLKREVFLIMTRYPSLEDAHVEWEALQQVPTPREKRSRARVRAGSTELGKQIRAARVERGYSQVELGRLLVKKNGSRLTQSAIQNYECGEAKPSAHVMEQLKQLLGLE